MANLASVDRSSWISLIAACIVVFCLVFIAPLLIHIYMGERETHERNIIIEKRIDDKIEKLEKELYGRRTQTKVDVLHGSDVPSN